MARKPKNADRQPSYIQTKFILANAKISISELARKFRVPRSVAKRWYVDIHGEKPGKKKLDRFETQLELEEHYHILCLWYLRGFSIQDILISYCGEVSYDEVIAALTYDDGKLFKRCYKKIKFAGNDVTINDDSELGLKLKEKVKKWDEYFARLEHGRRYRYYDDIM